MKSELPAIDWSALQHSYGSAEDVPEMLAALESPDSEVRLEARSALLHSLDHQGVQRWEATACAIPFLIELVEREETPDRHLLLTLLADFAIGETHSKYLLTGFRMEDVRTREGTKEYGSFVCDEKLRGTRTDFEIGELLQRIYDAAARGLPLYLALARSTDERIRDRAAHLLAWLTHASNEIVPVLQAQIASEPNALCRASQALALSYVTIFHRRDHDLVKPVIARVFREARDPHERMLAALALFLHPAPDDDVKNVLTDTIATATLTELPASSPWKSALRARTLVALTTKRAPLSWSTDLIEAGCRALAIADDFERGLVARLLVEYAFATNERAPSADDETASFQGHLTIAQRRLLRALSDDERVSLQRLRLVLDARGVPSDREELRAFLNRVD